MQHSCPILRDLHRIFVIAAGCDLDMAGGVIWGGSDGTRLDARRTREQKAAWITDALLLERLSCSLPPPPPLLARSMRAVDDCERV